MGRFQDPCHPPLPDMKQAIAQAVDPTGHRVVGIGFEGTQSAPSAMLGVVWKDGQSIVLKPLAPHKFCSAEAISGDVSTIVGSSWAEDAITRVAVVWPGKLEPTTLMVLAGADGSAASHVSEKGKVVVGTSWKKGSWTHIFRWTKEAGMDDLGNGAPAGVSSDGEVVACNLVSDDQKSGGCLWMKSGGLVRIPLLPNCEESKINAMTADGTVAVGTMWRGDKKKPTNKRPFLFKRGAPVIDLTHGDDQAWGEALAVDEKGENAAGWSFTSPDYSERLSSATHWSHEVETVGLGAHS